MFTLLSSSCGSLRKILLSEERKQKRKRIIRFLVFFLDKSVFPVSTSRNKMRDDRSRNSDDLVSHLLVPLVETVGIQVTAQIRSPSGTNLSGCNLSLDNKK